MKKICIMVMILTIISINALPCDADINQDLDIDMTYYGPSYDINHDGITNYLDASSIVAHYLETGTPGWIRTDLVEDGEVNYLDASGVVSHYGESWITT